MERKPGDIYVVPSTNPEEPEGHMILNLQCDTCLYVWPIALCHSYGNWCPACEGPLHAYEDDYDGEG